MSGFSVASVDVLTYDFTGFPVDGAQDPTQRCSGKGRIPEPSKAQLHAFYQALQDQLKAAAASGDAGDEIDALNESSFQAISDVCSGTPSVDELKQLPPRVLFAFAKYLAESLGPKA